MNKFLFFIIILSTSFFAQGIKNWQNFTNLREITGISVSESDVWAATNGGIFRYSSTDKSFQVFTKSEGLSSHIITTIAVDNYGKIWVGTSEGFINVYDPSLNEMNTILQIFKTDKSNKRINDILISGDTAYVSTAFGLSLINTVDLSFFDSILKFGNFNTETPVFSVYIHDKIYVVTLSGIATNSKTNNNLIAPDTWENISIDLLSGANRVNEIIKFNDKLYAATDDGLFIEENGSWDLLYYDNFEVFDLVIKNNELFSLLATSIYRINTDSELFFRMPNNIYSTMYLGNNQNFIGSNKGLIEWTGNDTLVAPNSPETNSIIDLAVDFESNLWVGTGKDGQGIGALKFDGSSWETIDRQVLEIFKTNDFHNITSSDEALYLSSWGSGFDI